jgi:excisionase family DNA binding protein
VEVREPGSSLSHRFISLSKAANYLGLTEKALRKRVERREIPFRRAGRKLVFDLLELDQWFENLPGTTLQEAKARYAEPARGSARDR